MKNLKTFLTVLYLGTAGNLFGAAKSLASEKAETLGAVTIQLQTVMSGFLQFKAAEIIDETEYAAFAKRSSVSLEQAEHWLSHNTLGDKEHSRLSILLACAQFSVAIMQKRLEGHKIHNMQEQENKILDLINVYVSTYVRTPRLKELLLATNEEVKVYREFQRTLPTGEISSEELAVRETKKNNFMQNLVKANKDYQDFLVSAECTDLARAEIAELQTLLAFGSF